MRIYWQFFIVRLLVRPLYSLLLLLPFFILVVIQPIRLIRSGQYSWQRFVSTKVELCLTVLFDSLYLSESLANLK